MSIVSKWIAGASDTELVAAKNRYNDILANPLHRDYQAAAAITADIARELEDRKIRVVRTASGGPNLQQVPRETPGGQERRILDVMDTPRLSVAATARRLGVKPPPGGLEHARYVLWQMCEAKGIRPVGYAYSTDPRLDKEGS